MAKASDGLILLRTVRIMCKLWDHGRNKNDGIC